MTAALRVKSNVMCLQASDPNELWRTCGAPGDDTSVVAPVLVARRLSSNVHARDLGAEERAQGHWLLIRRSIDDPSEVAYYVVFAP